MTGFPEIMDGGSRRCIRRSMAGSCRSATMPPMKPHAKPRHRVDRSPGGQSLSVEETLARGASADDIIENIDIGGPAMIRPRPRNHDGVAVIVEPADYGAVISELDCVWWMPEPGQPGAAGGPRLCRTASYDAAISAWFAEQRGAHVP